MSDTPRTDAAIQDYGYYQENGQRIKQDLVTPDFARQLERESDLLRKALVCFCDAFNNHGETTSLKEWNDRMKIANDSAKEVLAGRLPFADPQ